MKRRSPEHTFQTQVMNLLETAGRPELYAFAVPNGELRHINVARRLKAEGVKPGTPDICIMLEEGRTGWLELKAKGGTLSDAQKGFHSRCIRLEHAWACCKTLDEVIWVLRGWGVLRPGVHVKEKVA